MKQTLEEASQSMAYNKMPNWGGMPDVAKKYFIKGAKWQAEQSPWISIDEQLPEDKQPVLCSSQIYGKVVLSYDELSRTWSYPKSDEFYCEWDKVDCWMLIPEV